MSTQAPSHVSVDHARQSVGYLNQFLERLRQQKDVNVLNLFSYAELANLHVSMVRLNAHLAEPVTATTDTESVHLSQAVPVVPPQLHTI